MVVAIILMIISVEFVLPATKAKRKKTAQQKQKPSETDVFINLAFDK